MRIILAAVLFVFLVGSYRMKPALGYYGGGISLVLLIIVILLLLRII